jgi:hypothetical protein
MGRDRQRVQRAQTPGRPRRTPFSSKAEAPISVPGPVTTGPVRGADLSPLPHPTAPTLKPAAVLGLQHSHGNAHVARLLVQRDDAVTGTEDEKKRFGEIKKILDAIPTGKEAIAVLDKHKVKIKFDAAGGAEYDPSTNSITVDSNESNAEAALTLVHELNHARYEKEGLGADAEKMSREDYVKGMVEEEAEGTVKSIEAKIELEGTKIDVSKATFPMEKEYRKAYKKAVDAAKAKDPKTSEEDLKKVGRAAGKARVTKGFMDGEVVGSRSGKTYPAKYGEHWDAMKKWLDAQKKGGK